MGFTQDRRDVKRAVDDARDVGDIEAVRILQRAYSLGSPGRLTEVLAWWHKRFEQVHVPSKLDRPGRAC